MHKGITTDRQVDFLVFLGDSYLRITESFEWKSNKTDVLGANQKPCDFLD